MLPSRSGIITEAISIASTSVQQRQSISLASFLQCSYFKSSLPEWFCKKGVLINVAKFTGVSSGTGVSSEFREILKNVFFHRAPPVLLLAFAPIEISYFNNLCNKFAAEARIGLVSFYGGERWSQRLHFHKYFPRNNHFLH